ncbi:LPS biosynthesis glycosyltransferase [Parasedimentitalea maritima]|uniref:LPS biosynthesis glycosyltransferase n=2 Tax=Parasedimentitalea maritima TaxID=2578117 RepID=A0A6A4RI87_9RHOB|nr:LPS biosynthesis glycosyltransferase [Zongyanglinia marina]
MIARVIRDEQCPEMRCTVPVWDWPLSGWDLRSVRGSTYSGFATALHTRLSMSEKQTSCAALLNAFDKVFVINLPNRKDRRLGIDQQLKSVGLGLGHPDVCLFPAVRPRRKLGFPSIGTRGCFLSHIGVLEQAISMNLKRFLVLEDDADFSDNFSLRFREVSRYLKQIDWDMVYGHMPAGVPKPDFKQRMRIALVAPDAAIECLHFYGVSGRCAVKALPYLKNILQRPAGDPRGGAMHVDGAYSWFRKSHPELVTVAVDPPLAVQRPSRSDIHDLQWFDRQKLLRPMTNLARRLKRSVA